MSRIYDPARRERERMLLLDRRAAAQAEGKAVSEGVCETVSLSEARGSAFSAKSGRETTYRRQPGLEWLASKGRLSVQQRLAGERYGHCYRRAMSEGALPSTLDVKPRATAPGGKSLSATLAHAEGTAHAAARLARYRKSLSNQPALVAACNDVCGRELTPREATANEREAGRLEAVLMVALDILAAAGTP